MKDLAGSLEAFSRQNYPTRFGRMCKTEEDVVRYSHVLERVCPTLVVETGTWSGCSARWFADQDCHPLVLTIDTEPVTMGQGQTLEIDPTEHVRYLTGSSLDPSVISQVRTEVYRPHQGHVLVVLDSDHSDAHVFAEMCTYAPFVTRGSYLVVEDGIVRHLGPHRFGLVGSPLDAIERFLALQEENGGMLGTFEVDEEVEDLFPTTQFPCGWLRRVR